MKPLFVAFFLFLVLVSNPADAKSAAVPARPTWLHDFGLYVCKARSGLGHLKIVRVGADKGARQLGVKRLKDGDLMQPIGVDISISDSCVRRLDSLPALEMKNSQYFERLVPASVNKDEEEAFSEAGPSVIDIHGDGSGQFFFPYSCTTRFPLLALRYRDVFVLLHNVARIEDGIMITEVGKLSVPQSMIEAFWFSGADWREISEKTRLSMCK